jgi:hypothetical protein
MGSYISGNYLYQHQRTAFTAMVNALPLNTTSVGVVEFDSDANLMRVLTPLTSDKAAIIAAINSVDASGGTNIGSGINAAKAELIGSRHTVGRTQMMVVSSDGYTDGNPEINAASAMAAGVDGIHTVGLPGHSVYTMRDIIDGPDDIVGNVDDYGVYTDATNLSGLSGIFNGTTGNLVGIDHVTVTLPNGMVIANQAIDGLGNFGLSNWAIQLGANVFHVTAYDTSNNSATATLTLYGVSGGGAVPEPASVAVWTLLGALAFGYRRRKKSA